MDQKANILIVEDSKTQAIILKRVLLKKGYQVNVAVNGVEALEYVNTTLNSPDVIITDLNMPEMDGFQLCKTLKKTHPDTFIIVLTANEDNTSLKESFDSGAIDFLKKPINEVELFVRIKNVLRIKNAETKLKETLSLLSKNNKILEQLSITDPLTKLYNRKHLTEKLDQYIAHSLRYKNKLSIAMLDLDHFKAVNDTYGHSAGDEVLLKISDIFTRKTRETDIVGRYGGEEFLIITPETSSLDCYTLLKNISNELSNLRFSFDENYKLTFSAGIKQFNGESIDQFQNNADQLLYKAKENGRNRIEYST